MNKVLNSFAKRLTNLTSNNKSIFMSRVTESDLDLHELDYLNQQSSFNFIEQLFSKKKKILLCPVVDNRNEKINLISKKLKSIQRKEKLIYEERGAKDLYIAWPFVKGKLQDDTIIRCPLVYIPVSLVENNDNWILEARNEVAVTFNKSFLLAYSFFNKRKLDDDFIETTLEDFFEDSQSFRVQLYELLKNSPVDVNFNQELFENKLSSFEYLNKNKCDEIFATGVLKLYPEAVLGLFPQSGSFLIPDYEAINSKLSFENFEQFFLDKTNVHSNHSFSEKNFKIKEEQTFTPFALDASQEEVIVNIKLGNSLVVQGPPGTGKSQLICNIISDYIARGKKVLVVCQKKAALDVVFERLKNIELDAFIALIHDFKNDRHIIFNKILNQIEHIENYRKENNSLKSLNLEREFLLCSRTIDEIVETISDFKKSLFKISDFGLSVKEMYLACDKGFAKIHIDDEFKYFNNQKTYQFSKKLNAYFQYYYKYGNEEYPLYNRKSWDKLKQNDFSNLHKILNEIKSFDKIKLLKFDEKFRLSFIKLNQEELQNLILICLKTIDSIADPVTLKYLVLQYKCNVNSSIFFNFKNLIEIIFKEGIEITIDRDSLELYNKVFIEAYQLKRNNAVRFWFWKTFSTDFKLLNHVFKNNKLTMDDHGFSILNKKLENRNKLEKEILNINTIGFPISIVKIQIDEWLERQITASRINELINKTVLNSLIDASLSFEQFIEEIRTLHNFLKYLFENNTTWTKYFDKKLIFEALINEDFLQNAIIALNDDFQLLVEFDELKVSFSNHENTILNKLHSGNYSGETATNVFKNSVLSKWIEEVENLNPILKMVSSIKLDQFESELQNCILEKSSISRAVILARLKEQVYKSNTFNRLNNRITYRDLKHQVSKKKKLWPVRKIVENFAEELFTLIPCWLTSPEAVSAIFPIEQEFDLVIFDEASQCFTEKSIPAMHRGKQIVITGDSQQLRPSDIYLTRFEEEEEMPDNEMNSVLELAEKYLKTFSLQQHYRSKRSELINFSNHHFYKGKLEMLSDYNYLVNYSKTPAIKYEKVDGIWETGVNEEEAKAVIEILLKLFAQNISSIGIVAFNYKQAECIQDHIDKLAASNGVNVPDSVFVKNIENVQGDERDVIIFSIGYAPDPSGKMHMQFGSLNQEGGSNRINVAITRAKEQVYIVTSILPNQLAVSESKNEGPKILKKYLEYAYNISNSNTVAVDFGNVKNSNFYLSDKILSDNSVNTSIKSASVTDFTDMIVLKNNFIQKLLLTDDQKYQDSKSIKDYHAYRPMRIKTLNWKYKMLHSRNYFLNKYKFMDSLNDFIKL